MVCSGVEVVDSQVADLGAGHSSLLVCFVEEEVDPLEVDFEAEVEEEACFVAEADSLEADFEAEEGAGACFEAVVD